MSEGSIDDVYLPPWAGSGCSVIDEWEEKIVSGGAKGIRTRIKFKNAKGKIIILTKLIKWDG